MKQRRRPRQLELPQPSPISAAGVDSKITYNRIHRRHATFKGGVATQVHRWFRLTPSFGPDLVQEMLTVLRCRPDDVVLDPFSGAGTTLIECQLEGLTAYGLELNPFLSFVCDACLHWDLDTEDVKTSLARLRRTFSQLTRFLTLDNVEAHGLALPSIHNPTRWWRPDVLTDLLALRHSIDSSTDDPNIQRFLRLALAGVLVPDLTNVTLGRLQLHFIDRSSDEIDVMGRFSEHVLTMLSDIDDLNRMKARRTAFVWNTDSTATDGLRLPSQVSCVVTSPPYPNRYSYVWNTRPHLYLLGFLSTPRHASDLDKRTIGGTWGMATSELAKGQVPPKYPIIREVVGPVVEAIRTSDNLMANYAMKYFNSLADQIVSMDTFLHDDARVAYVVGCSRLKGVFIETDVLLGHIFEGLNLNYRVAGVERIRKRNSGENLHESIVYAWKR